MKDYFDLIWDDTKPYLLLDYDKSLNKAINIRSLVNRVSLSFSFDHDNNEMLHPSILVFEHLKDITVGTIKSTRLNNLRRDLEDIKSLWNTQSLMYDYETDPYLKIYGSFSVGKTTMYNLGITTIIDKSGKSVSPLTLNKAMAASTRTHFLYLTMSNEGVDDNDMFNFSKFIQERSS